MKQKNALANQSASSPSVEGADLKKVFQFVAEKTSEAKKAAADNPYTSSGKLKSELYGAAKFTNSLKEEGREAHKRGIVTEPTMFGGLQNRDMNTAAEAALKTFDLIENPAQILPGKKKRKSLKNKV